MREAAVASGDAPEAALQREASELRPGALRAGSCEERRRVEELGLQPSDRAIDLCLGSVDRDEPRDAARCVQLDVRIPNDRAGAKRDVSASSRSVRVLRFDPCGAL